MSGKSTQQFRRIIGQKRITALSHFTKNGKPVPGEKRADFLARMREEWRRLGEDAKKAVQTDVINYKHTPPQTEEEKNAYLRRKDFLKQLGYSFFYRIDQGTSTLNSESPAAASASIPTPRPPKGEKELERAKLRREVQNLFNDLYGQATGKRGNFPYKKHNLTPDVAVTGLPHGVPFKEPYSYGLPALKAIVAQKSQIKMHMVQASLSENAAPVTPGEDTAAAREASLWQQLLSLDASVPPQGNGDVPVVAVPVVALSENAAPVTPGEDTAAAREASLWQQLLSFDAAVPPQGNGDVSVVAVPVVAEVLDMEIAAPEVIAAPPPQQITDVPVNVEVLQPLSTNVQPSGVLDANALLESQHPQQGLAEKSTMKRAGTKSQWTAEEVAAVSQHFTEELEGRRLVQIGNIKEFVATTKFARTAIAVQNFLLRRRKVNRTK